MAKRIYPLQRIKYWWAYDIDEICILFSEFGLHPQTVRKWIKEGLGTIDNGKPALVYGFKLRAFLAKLNDKGKCKTEFDEIYCVACHEGRKPFRKQVKFEQKQDSVKVSARCPSCKNIINQNYSLNDYYKLKKIFQAVDVLELYDSENTAVNTHIADQEQSNSSEQYSWGHF